MKSKVVSVCWLILIVGVVIFTSLTFGEAPVGAIANTPKNVAAEGNSTEVNGTTTMVTKTCGEILSEKENIKQSILEVSELFISSCFSANSNLDDQNFIYPNSSHFKKYVNNRHYLINLRREAFSNSKTLENFTLQINDMDVKDDCAIVLARARECYSYLDEPNQTAASIVEYLIVLRNTDSGWKVYWATSNDAYSKMIEEQTSFGKINGLVLPWCKDNGFYLVLGQTIRHSATAIFQHCDNFTYNNFNNLIANEEKNIKKELGELRDNVNYPQGTGDFSRFAMKSYQNNWALSRNPIWADYTGLGGDCQNYASQVIKAGGAPFDESGSYKWYWYSDANRSPSWTGVISMQNYIRYNSGLGPNGKFVSSASTLLTGDMVHIDLNSNGTYDHAVVIYNPGSSPTVSGHTEDCINKRLSEFPGTKQYICLTHYGT